MKVCAISFKECWTDSSGSWYSDGGFPRQMAAIGSLFDEMDLLIVRTEPRSGGLLLPANARIVELDKPEGAGFTRKLFVLAKLHSYVRTIGRHVGNADVVHVPLPGDIPLIGFGVALVLRKKLIARYGGSWERTGLTTVMNKVTRACLRTFAGGRNVMLATGEGPQPPNRHMHWVYASALTNEELAAIRPVLQRGLSRPPSLVYIGRLAPEKGVSVLLRSFAELMAAGLNPCPTLTIIGDGPDRKLLDHMCSDLGIADRVTFTGQLDRESLSLQIAGADLCVQASLSEGFSKAWLDAMAHGLPVVASRVGAAASVIGEDRGWLVAPGDAPALAKLLRDVLTAPRDWPALRQRCRAYAEARTLDHWRDHIGRICAQRWNCSLVGGKLQA